MRHAIPFSTILSDLHTPWMSGARRSGAVYVFEKPAGGWSDATETAKLRASDESVYDHLGMDVAVLGDTVVAGGSNWYDNEAYVFEKPASGWSRTATVSATASRSPARRSSSAPGATTTTAHVPVRPTSSSTTAPVGARW